MAEKKINKTERILSIYHLLIYCEEVSFKEMTDLMPGSEKTFSRDIELLRNTGVPVYYSKKKKAFILKKTGDISSDRIEMRFPEEKTKILYFEKIIRLTKMMCEMDSAEEPEKWYAEMFPGLSKRTMERDFAVLNAIGYKIRYKRSEDDDIGDYDSPLNKYYCEWPYNTYGLETFYYF